MDFLVALGGALIGSAVLWLEAVFGRYKLRRYLAAGGYVLKQARWRGPISLRQSQYRITVERDGEIARGRAYLGGWFTGPVWSSQIKFDWDSPLPTGEPNPPPTPTV